MSILASPLAVSANRETEQSQTCVNSNGNFKHELSAKHHLPRLRTLYIHGLMREEKEGRKKQARSYKQQGKAIQHTQGKATLRWPGRVTARFQKCATSKLLRFQIGLNCDVVVSSIIIIIVHVKVRLWI